MTQPATPTPEQIAREAVLYCRHTADRKGFEGGACFDCIASALSSATPRWIPVEEQMPPRGQIVVAVPKGSVPMLVLGFVIVEKPGKYHAWTPLPKEDK